MSLSRLAETAANGPAADYLRSHFEHEVALERVVEIPDLGFSEF
jgi:hypothetical protein